MPIIAYEPVWGSLPARAAYPTDAREMHEAIRAVLQKKYGAAEFIRVIYMGVRGCPFRRRIPVYHVHRRLPRRRCVARSAYFGLQPGRHARIRTMADFLIIALFVAAAWRRSALLRSSMRRAP